MTNYWAQFWAQQQKENELAKATDYPLYQWIVETVDNESGDVILEHNVDSKYSFIDVGFFTLWGALQYQLNHIEDESHIDIVLRKEDTTQKWGHSYNYAYVENGKLPEFFNDGYRIPNRFHDVINQLAYLRLHPEMGTFFKVKISHTLEIDTESWERVYGNKFDKSDEEHIQTASCDYLNQHYKDLGVLKGE